MIDPRRSVLLSILVVAAVWLVTLGATERRGLWITDNANKFLQVRAVLANGPGDLSISWPGRALDPELEFNPLPPPFSVVADGKLYSQYPPFFAVVSALPYRVLGFDGLYLLPFLSSILMLAGLSRLAGQAGLGPAGRHATVLLAGLCTPVWFYAVVFWEHALAVCCLVWSLHHCLRSREEETAFPLIAGAALSAGAVWFRDESLLFCALVFAFALAGARGRRLRRLALAGGSVAVTLVPLVLFQWATIGSPLGHHVRANLGSLGDHLASRGAVFYKLLLASHSSLLVSIAISAPFVVAFVWGPRLSPRLFRRGLPLVALFATLAAAASLEGFLSSGQPIVHLMRTNSLFPAAPILLLALVGLRGGDPGGDSADCWIRRFALGYALLYLLAAPKVATAGIHWGNRFLFPVYPLLAVLAARNLSHWVAARKPGWSWQAAAVASTLAISLAAQGYSIHLLREKKDFSFRLNRELERREETIVLTDVWWAPQAMFSSFDDRAIFYARSPAQMDRLWRRLRLAGRERVLFVTAASRDGQRGTGELMIDDGRLNFFSLSFRDPLAGR